MWKIIYVGNGSEAYSSNLYIPAKSELTSRDDTVVRHVYFQQFNENYQNLTTLLLIKRGDPITQLILEKVSLPILTRVDELLPTDRGEKGCGFHSVNIFHKS